MGKQMTLREHLEGQDENVILFFNKHLELPLTMLVTVEEVTDEFELTEERKPLEKGVTIYFNRQYEEDYLAAIYLDGVPYAGIFATGGQWNDGVWAHAFFWLPEGNSQFWHCGQEGWQLGKAPGLAAETPEVMLMEPSSL